MVQLCIYLQKRRNKTSNKRKIAVTSGLKHVMYFVPPNQRLSFGCSSQKVLKLVIDCLYLPTKTNHQHFFYQRHVVFVRLLDEAVTWLKQLKYQDLLRKRHTTWQQLLLKISRARCQFAGDVTYIGMERMHAEMALKFPRAIQNFPRIILKMKFLSNIIHRFVCFFCHLSVFS